MEDDVVGLKRVVLGQDVVVCELCGLAAGEVMVERLGGGRNVAEPVEFLRVCPDCRDRLDRGEIQLEAEIDTGLDDGLEDTGAGLP